MNMHAKPEIFVPAFTGFDVAKIKVDADVARFTLQYGCVEIDCEMLANELSDSTCMNGTNDPQNDVEVNYTKCSLPCRQLRKSAASVGIK